MTTFLISLAFSAVCFYLQHRHWKGRVTEDRERQESPS
jgi:hypothetical protein